MDARQFLHSFRPHKTPVTVAEKLRSGLAGGLAILLLGILLHALPQHSHTLLLIAPMAASAVLLFATPHSPLAQPWNLVGGHLFSAVAGLLCALFIPDPLLASSLAVGSAIALMYLADCLHPPGAATALMLVLSHTQVLETGWQWALWMVVANAVGSLLLSILINNLIPGRHYPAIHILPPQPSPKTQTVLDPDDIEWALGQMDSALDISTEDLQDIYVLAIQHAELRQTPSRA